MEHMKRMLTIAVAVILAGAALMYVHRNMYSNCSDDVKVQYQETLPGYQSGYNAQNSTKRSNAVA